MILKQKYILTLKLIYVSYIVEYFEFTVRLTKQLDQTEKYLTSE